MFFALWPSASLREEIITATEAHVGDRSARAIPPENLHITLAFLGSIGDERVSDVIAAAEEVRAAPFELRISHLESWRRARVLALTIDPTPEPLQELVDRLRNKLAARQVDVDGKEFRCHVTLAREWSLQKIDRAIGPFLWQATQFALVESTTSASGSKYQTVRTWPLIE